MPGEMAVVVTYLELTRRPMPSPVSTSPLRIRRWKDPDPAKYRVLFRRVGTPWLWFSRLVMEDARLTEIIGNPLVEIYPVLDPKGIEVGLLELDFRKEECCEIAFLALVPQLIGQGLGGWLLGQAMTLGWRKDIRRMTVHTSSADDPRALPLYRKHGFEPIRRAIETFGDPRLLGIIDKDAAPHIPVVPARGC
jgi:GNAT superfamily N-acetyltransferase